MIVRDEKGSEFDWAIPLDHGARHELARWRDFVEARLSMPAGSIRSFQWNEAGDLTIVVRRDKVLGE
jgi:hypothetical protein